MAIADPLGQLDDAEGSMNDINMTPLIDVMLVLLIIFIITIPVITHTVKVSLPQASNVPVDPQQQVVAIEIAADGTIGWEGRAVTLAQLAEHAAAAARTEPAPVMQIAADRRVPYEAVAQVLAEVQSAGLAKVNLITSPGAQPAASANPSASPR